MTQNSLLPIRTGMVDGENAAIIYDTAYAVRSGASAADLPAALSAIRRIHGEEICLLPISGGSSGEGLFRIRPDNGKPIIGLRIEPAVKPEVRFGRPEITGVGLGQVFIDMESMEVRAGAAITLEQLNRSLIQHAGSPYRVLGADLTSYSYAQVGSTFMTGGMGPQRRYFSDSVLEIALLDGHGIRRIGGSELQGYAGTLGWTGLVSAVRCRFHRLPENEIAFALPVSNDPESLAGLLSHLSPYCYLDLDNRTVSAASKGENIVLGLEHVTVSSMQPLLNQGINNEITKRGQELADKCRQADAEGLIFVNGFSHCSGEDFLFDLVDDMDAQTPTIAGIQLHHAEMFRDPEQMRILREAIPFAARTQLPDSQYIYKNHTDANFALDPDQVLESMTRFWQWNLEYVRSIEDYFRSTENLRGEIIIYGHLNPAGIDPHNRITMACDDKPTFDQAVVFLTRQRNRYFRNVQNICELYNARLIGGEKSAASECKIFPAFGGVDKSPEALKRKFHQQNRRIKMADTMFNWRTLPPYGE